MGAITGIVPTGAHFALGTGGSVPGGLWAEVWSVPASTAGDTQTITPNYVSPLFTIGGSVENTVIAAGATTVALTTLATIAASNFATFLVVGPRKASSP